MEKKKKQGSRKKQGLEGQGSGKKISLPVASALSVGMVQRNHCACVCVCVCVCVSVSVSVCVSGPGILRGEPGLRAGVARQ